MKSVVTRDFRRLFEALPPHVKSRARSTYALWKDDSKHPGVQFKRVHPSKSIYSVRVGTGSRLDQRWRQRDSRRSIVS